jgi:hypothetical protein
MLASVLSDDSLRCALVRSADYGTQGALQCTCDERLVMHQCGIIRISTFASRANYIDDWQNVQFCCIIFNCNFASLSPFAMLV